MKKQLLNEQEIRKFMKFAEIGSLADGFVDRLDEGGMMYKDDEEEGLEAGGADMGGEMAMGGGEELPAEEPVGDDAPVEEPAEDPMADAGAEGADMSAEDKLAAILGAAADKAQELGIDMDVSGGEPEGAALDEPVGDEAPVEEPVAAAGEEGVPPEEGEGEELEEDVFLEDDSDLVNEVARRVARRLMSAKRSGSNKRARRRR